VAELVHLRREKGAGSVGWEVADHAVWAVTGRTVSLYLKEPRNLGSAHASWSTSCSEPAPSNTNIASGCALGSDLMISGGQAGG
jgi:hypothetical protein